MTEFEEYFSQVYDGRIVACEKMKQVSEMLLTQFAMPGKYHFDERFANAPIVFIETFCKQPTGKIGVPLRLELFQKARLQALFGFVNDEGTRQYNECLIVEGRKNGKTTEMAALENFMLLADREVFNLPPIEDGDRHFIRGEYRPVDSYEGSELTSEIAEGDALPPISGNTTVDKALSGGIIEAREPVFGDGHKIVDNTPEGGDESGSNGNSDKETKTDDRFDIHPDKINNFLLKPGAKHSKDFFDVGYKEDDYDRLFDDIAKGYDKKKAVDPRPDKKHNEDSFSIFMELGVIRQERFRTVWEQSRDKGSKPRLITAHRED